MTGTKKLHKHQILSSLSLQVLLSVGSSLPCCGGSWPLGCGCDNGWEVENSNGGIADQLQLPVEKKETTEGAGTKRWGNEELNDCRLRI